MSVSLCLCFLCDGIRDARLQRLGPLLVSSFEFPWFCWVVTRFEIAARLLWPPPVTVRPRWTHVAIQADLP